MTITSNLDLVRLKIGDTDEDDPLLFDDEIAALISARTIVTTAGTTVLLNAAAADAAGAVAAKFARAFDFSTDGQNFQRAQRVGHYQALERELRNLSGGYSVPIGGTATV